MIADPYYAFCVDLFEYIDNDSGTQYNLVDPSTIPLPPKDGIQPMGVAKANLLRELYGERYNSLFDGTNDVTDRQAFQLAVWEVVYETGNTLSLSGTTTKGNLYVYSGWRRCCRFSQLLA